MEKKNIYKALAKFQQEVPVLLKGTDGYGYKYIQLEHIIAQINPLLKKHDLGFTQLIGGSGLTTILFHHPSGEDISSSCIIPECDMKGMNKFQSAGAGITYFRRYALSSMLGIISDQDTDAKVYTTVAPKIKAKSEAITKVTLEVDSKDWINVLKYISNSEIKALGLPVIVEQLQKKFNITAKTKKELSKHI
jgi:hypothetical protein|tara:strand:- start:579 stop:1154 length:576 start_codon:yes stop_codon:yes gene_type:complete